MKFKLVSGTNKKSKWRYLFGMYTLSSKNKNNTKISSTTLNVLAVISIITFIAVMLLSFYLIGSITYSKMFVTEKDYTTKASSFNIVLPSISKDTLKDTVVEQQQVESGALQLQDVQKRSVFFIPFYLFIPIIFIISGVHELGHYIMCRRAGIKVKEYGLGCLALFCIPVPLFFGFVEPDDKQLKKSSKFDYLSMVSFGVVMNIVMAGIFLGLVLLIPTYFFLLAFLMNLGVGFFNAMPLFIIDGGLFVKKVNPILNIVMMTFTILLLAAFTIF